MTQSTELHNPVISESTESPDNVRRVGETGIPSPINKPQSCHNFLKSMKIIVHLIYYTDDIKKNYIKNHMILLLFPARFRMYISIVWFRILYIITYILVPCDIVHWSAAHITVYRTVYWGCALFWCWVSLWFHFTNSLLDRVPFHHDSFGCYLEFYGHYFILNYHIYNSCAKYFWFWKCSPLWMFAPLDIHFEH